MLKTPDNTKADLLLKNGIIRTMDAHETCASALAVREGKIIFVGDEAGAQAYCGPGTEVIDLKGRMALPGMIDTHLHAPGNVLTKLFDINLHGLLRLEETLKTIKDFVRENPEREVYYGEGFSLGIFEGLEVSLGPRKERLDEICPAKPIFLTSYDGHSYWLNSKALEVCGISRDTPNPPGGVIERDPQTGEPWGTLKEAAGKLFREREYTREENLKALLHFQKELHSLGYTGILSISGFSPVPLPEYKALEDQGLLKLRVAASMTLDPEKETESQVEELKRLRSVYNSSLIKVTTAKFFTDGVVEGVTAYLLEPYAAEAGKGTDYYGEFLWEPERLKEAFALVNSSGFQIHVHSVGDASTRTVLDALEYAREKSPPGDYRNTLTHLQLVAPEDIPRFRSLDLVASTQPYWHFKEPGWWEPVDKHHLGSRAERMYPLKSFLKLGIPVVSSSDHPVTPYPNPLWAIRAGVTRNLSHADYYGVDEITDPEDPRYLLDRSERASLSEMVRSFTSASAYTIFSENSLGTLEPGKRADIAVLERDIFSLNPLEIDKVPVEITIFNGEVVYTRESAGTE